MGVNLAVSNDRVFQILMNYINKIQDLEYLTFICIKTIFNLTINISTLNTFDINQYKITIKI